MKEKKIMVYHQEYPYFPKMDKYTYLFDDIFSPSCKQEDIYKSQLQGKLERALEGYNSSLILFGAKNSWKNYTMFGNLEAGGGEEETGILQLLFTNCFEKIKDLSVDYTVTLQMMEILYVQTAEKIKVIIYIYIYTIYYI